MEIKLNKYGDILYYKLTEEPAMVLWQFKYFTFVRRPVMGRDGIRYKLALPLSSELETLQEQTTRTVATIQARNSIAQAEFGDSVNMPPLQFPKSN